MINQSTKRSGGIEKHLLSDLFPFFTFVTRGAESSRSNTTDGKFAFRLEQGQGVGYYTGPIMPISLIQNDELRHKLMEAIEYLKSFSNESDMKKVRKAFQAYLNNHGLGGLKFETQQNLKGFVTLKIEQSFFESILPKLEYVTAFDITSDTATVYEHKPSLWNNIGDILFWFHGWPIKNGYCYSVPMLYLVFEEVEHPILSYRYSWYRDGATSINIKKYFDLKKDVNISTLERVWIAETSGGWSTINFTINANEYEVICSNAYDPFEILFCMAKTIDDGELPMIFTIEEEGPEKRFEAYDTGVDDRFYFILSNPYAEDNEPIVEGIFSKKAFSLMMKEAFRDFFEHRYIEAEWDWYPDKDLPSFKERFMNDPWMNS